VAALQQDEFVAAPERAFDVDVTEATAQRCVPGVRASSNSARWCSSSPIT
jgi:hypothetical protein